MMCNRDGTDIVCLLVCLIVGHIHIYMYLDGKNKTCYYIWFKPILFRYKVHRNGLGAVMIIHSQL